MAWALLPNELLSSIFGELGCKDLTTAVCVNSRWNSFASTEAAWKEAILNDSLPHNYSYSQKEAPWRQIVQRHFETKRNITKKKCVQFTFGTSSPTSKPGCNIFLRTKSAAGKYCLLVWNTMDSPWNSYTVYTHIATELWDMEKRTKIRTYEGSGLGLLFNDFFIQEISATELCYAKFDPDQDSEDKLELQRIPLERNDYGLLIKRNDDEKSSLIALYTNTNDDEVVAWVYDLRTGSKVRDCSYDGFLEQFIGDKMVFKFPEIGYLILDIMTNEEIFVHEPKMAISCGVLGGDEMWIASAKEKCLIKHNIFTKERKKFTIDADISNAYKLQIFDGILWIHCRHASIVLLAVTSNSCQFLTRLTLPGRDDPDIAQMPNGDISILSSSYARIMSFRNEAVELPIQVLQIEPIGQNRIVDIEQGDLNAFILKHSPYLHSLTSQIVHSDHTGRYCVIFMHTHALHKIKPVNTFAETAKKWIANVSYAKSGIFQLALLDLADKTSSVTPPMNPTARGTCWVFYERKVFSGGWQKSIPDDHWYFFKTKIRIN